MTDEEILSCAANAADALDATRVSEMRPGGWHATTIFDGDAGLIRFGRLIEKAVKAAPSEERRSGWRDVATDPPEACTPEGKAPMFVLGWFPGMDFPRIEAANQVRWWANAEDPIPGAQWMPLPDGPSTPQEGA